MLGTRTVALVFPETSLQPLPGGGGRGSLWLIDVFVERFGPGMSNFCAPPQAILRPPNSIPILICQMRKQRLTVK